MQSRTVKAVCALLAVGVGASGWFAYNSTKTVTPTVTSRTATVTVGDVSEKVAASGAVSSPQTTTLSFPTSGTLTALNVAKGDMVTKGQLLARIDDTNARTAVVQAKTSISTAEARLSQLRAGLTKAERSQLDFSLKQTAAQVETARRQLDDARASVEAGVPTYETQLATAIQNEANARTTAALNAKNYQAAVDSASAGLENAKQNAELSARNYQSAIDVAQTAVETAKRNAELSATSYQVAVDQAKVTLDNTKTNASYSLLSLQNAVDQAQTSFNTETVALTQAQAEFDAAGPALTAATDDYNAKKTLSDQFPKNTVYVADTAAAKVVFDKATTTYDSAKSKLAAQTKTVVSVSNQLRNAQISRDSQQTRDGQGVKSAEQTTVTNALNAQTAGLEKDQNTIRSAEQSVANAISAQTVGVAKDKQSIKTAETALQNALTAQDAGVVKDNQSIATASKAIETTRNSQSSSQLKDAQQIKTNEAAVKSAELAVQNARLNNVVKLAPAKQADVLAAVAAVDSARVSLQTAEKSLRETSLLAPFDGLVSAQNGIVGTTVGSGGSSGASASSFLEITSVEPLVVKAGFSEANAAKITAGQSASVTFDALPSVSIDATVASIDQTATASNGVATYYVTLRIPGSFAQGVKPGMTAQVEIAVKEANGVLLLPSNAVTKRGSRAFVTVRDGKVDTRTPVEIGVIGTSGTEIVSGLTEGQVVVIPQTVVQSTTGSRTGAGGAGGGFAPPGGGGGGGLVRGLG